LIAGRQWTANDDIYVKLLTDNYEKGRVLEESVAGILESFHPKPHWVFDNGPDLEFRIDNKTFKAELLNWAITSKSYPVRMKRMLQNLRECETKAVICSFQVIFTSEQLSMLKKLRIHILELGYQIIPDYMWSRIKDKFGKRKESERTLKVLKNQVMSFFSRILSSSLIPSNHPLVTRNRVIDHFIRILVRTIYSITGRNTHSNTHEETEEHKDQ